MSQLSEIRSDIQANWPANYHSTDLTDAKTDEFINKIQRQICRRYNFTWMKQRTTWTTVDNQRAYALPTAGDSNWTDAAAGTVRKFKSEISCNLVNSSSYIVPLTKKYKRDIEEDSDYRNTAAYGTPDVYCVAGFDLELYKLPHSDANNGSNFTIDLEFHGYLGDMSADGDTNAITDDYPEILEYGATALGYRFGMDTDMAEYYENKMNELMVEMIKADQIKEISGIEVGLSPEDGQEIGAGD